MHTARKDLAVQAFERLDLTGGNRRLAVYWLSLWNGGRMPARAQFQPSACAICCPVSASSRSGRASAPIAGSRAQLARAIGRDLTGRSWQDYTPQDERKLRLERNSAIATGSVGIGVRYARDPYGELERTIELQLPFGDVAEDGTRQILFHLDWRAPKLSAIPKPNPEGPHIADQFFAVPLG